MTESEIDTASSRSTTRLPVFYDSSPGTCETIRPAPSWSDAPGVVAFGAVVVVRTFNINVQGVEFVVARRKLPFALGLQWFSPPAGLLKVRDDAV